MWVLLGIFLLVIIVIIAVIVYVDQTKDDEDDNAKGNQGSNSLMNRPQPSSELPGFKVSNEFFPFQLDCESENFVFFI